MCIFKRKEIRERAKKRWSHLTEERRSLGVIQIEKAKNPKNEAKRKKFYQNQRPRIRIETHKINDFSTIKNIHVILHPLALEPMKEKNKRKKLQDIICIKSFAYHLFACNDHFVKLCTRFAMQTFPKPFGCAIIFSCEIFFVLFITLDKLV